MYRVGIIGPESTGKSSLALYLANRYKGTYVPEDARTYIEQKGNKEVSYDELCAIAQHQIEELRTYSVPESNSTEEEPYSDVVFFDTELIVTKVWFEYAFGKMPEWLEEAIRAYPMDVYLLTYPDLPWVPDPARYNGDEAMRLELFKRYESEIQALDIPYYVIKHETPPSPLSKGEKGNW